MPARQPALGSSFPARGLHRLSASEIAWLGLIAFAIVSACLVRRGEERSAAMADASRAPLANVEAKAAALAATLAADCPLLAPDDVAPREACRKRLFVSPLLRASLGPLVLWGRHDPRKPIPLADSDLLQIAPSTLIGTYLPLLAFDGRFVLAWRASEGLWRLELSARHRSALGSAARHSPLRHEDDLEAGLEQTEAIVLWLERDSRTIFAVQAVGKAAPPAPAAVAGAARPPATR